MDEKREEEFARQFGNRIMPNKLQFDNQKNKKKNMKNKQKEAESKRSRDPNTVKAVRWSSMEDLKPELSGDQAVECHSDVSEKVQTEKTGP